MDIYLVGYRPKYFFKKKHTNFWPWTYMVRTFRELGYNAYHKNANEIDHKKLRQLCTNILIEAKEYLKTVPLESDKRFNMKIDKVVDSMRELFL